MPLAGRSSVPEECAEGGRVVSRYLKARESVKSCLRMSGGRQERSFSQPYRCAGLLRASCCCLLVGRPGRLLFAEGVRARKARAGDEAGVGL